MDTPGSRHDWSHRGRWTGRRHPTFLLPAVLALIQVVGTRAAAVGQPGARPLDGLAYALLVAGPAAFAIRHRWSPVTGTPSAALRAAITVVVAVGVTTAYFTLGYPGGPGFLAALVAVMAAAAAGQRLLTWLVVGAAYLTYAFAWRLWPDAAHPPLGRLVILGAWLLVLLAVAESIRVRTAHFAEMARTRAERERAAAEAAAEQERAAAELRRRKASEERLRIARELHDVLGHHLSLINVQAGVGLHLMDERPEQARDALTAIKHASAEALREVRAVLGALRPQNESPPLAPAPGLAGSGPAPAPGLAGSGPAPAPGLAGSGPVPASGLAGSGPPDPVAGLRALVADVTAAGLHVDMRVSGAPRHLPAAVDRAAYRIVQEALTNVRRHAGAGAVATVRVAYGHDDVAVVVADNGEGGRGDTAVADHGSPGTGLAGMRERTEALGGRFRAGPGSDGGFEVCARLPAAEGSTPEGADA